jgi:hypothetical protein
LATSPNNTTPTKKVKSKRKVVLASLDIPKISNDDNDDNNDSDIPVRPSKRCRVEFKVRELSSTIAKGGKEEKRKRTIGF